MVEENSQQIEIRMMGGFSIKLGDKVFTDARNTTPSLLLKYLILNRKKKNSQEKLINVLWGHSEKEIGNPANALRNLVYRIRTELSKTFGEEIYFVVFQSNVYMFNPETDCVVDCELFEDSFKQATSAQNEDEKLELYKKTAELYKGEFLPESAMQDWVSYQNNIYVRMFCECAHGAAEILTLRGDYNEAIKICETATQVEPFEESLHDIIITALINTGNSKKAISHYEYIRELFYFKLGVEISDEIKGKIKEASKAMHAVKSSMEAIGNDLKEGALAEEAYYCDYDVFRNLHRIQARTAERFGQSVFVALLTIKQSDDNDMNIDIPEIMKTLKNILMLSLRKSDVISRYSTTQYVIMMPTNTFENGQMVLKRITDRFNKRHKEKAVFLITNLKTVE